MYGLQSVLQDRVEDLEGQVAANEARLQQWNVSQRQLEDKNAWLETITKLTRSGSSDSAEVSWLPAACASFQSCLMCLCMS